MAGNLDDVADTRVLSGIEVQEESSRRVLEDELAGEKPCGQGAAEREGTSNGFGGIRPEGAVQFRRGDERLPFRCEGRDGENDGRQDGK